MDCSKSPITQVCGCSARTRVPHPPQRPTLDEDEGAAGAEADVARPEARVERRVEHVVREVQHDGERDQHVRQRQRHDEAEVRREAPAHLMRKEVTADIWQQRLLE